MATSILIKKKADNLDLIYDPPAFPIFGQEEAITKIKRVHTPRNNLKSEMERAGDRPMTYLGEAGGDCAAGKPPGEGDLGLGAVIAHGGRSSAETRQAGRKRRGRSFDPGFFITRDLAPEKRRTNFAAYLFVYLPFDRTKATATSGNAERLRWLIVGISYLSLVVFFI